MPKPGYIICSVAGAIDTFTNSPSAFQVIESVPIVKVVPGQSNNGLLGGPLTMRVLTTWIREDCDSAEQSFESQIVGLFPHETEEVLFGEFEPFTFKTSIHRLIIPEIKIPGYPGPGILFVEARLRKVGETQWLASQRFPILLEEIPFPLPPQESGTEQKQAP